MFVQNLFKKNDHAVDLFGQHEYSFIWLWKCLAHAHDFASSLYKSKLGKIRL